MHYRYKKELENENVEAQNIKAEVLSPRRSANHEECALKGQ